MKYLVSLTVAFALAGGIAVGPAHAAVCQTETMSCGTTMPIGGYCECTAKGKTEGGDVIAKALSKKPVNATAGGCGAQGSNCR